jgi:hypothetical protein
MNKNHLFARAYWSSLLIFILILTSCTFPTINAGEDQSAAITQTFAAVNLSIAQTQAAMLITPAIIDTPIPAIVDTVTPSPTETALPTATIEHKTLPGEPPGGTHSGMTDADSSGTAGEQRARAGEFFTMNLYERPFNANTMDVYYPDLDIQKGVLNRSGDWVYVVITLKGPSPEGTMRGFYGLEVDMDLDGRGDVLIMGGQPGAAWSTDNVRVWQDSNNDVGDNAILSSDPPQAGDGYDKIIFDAGVGADADLAWVRRSPSNTNAVDIAFKASAINNDAEYIWGAWTDLGVMNAAWFDYNDHFTHAEAGSPLKEVAQHYPIKALFEVDNTCRWTVGFAPKGDEPGICSVPATPTPTFTVTPSLVPSNITGIVFRDGNGDLAYQSGESPLGGASVHLYSGSCGSGGGEIASTNTGSDGRYNFGGINPGTYCVDVNPAPATYTARTPATSVTVGVPKTHIVNFGYFYLG